MDMVAREQEIVDNMTLQCEKEKEALLDQFAKSLTESHEIKIKDLQTKIAELENKKCEPIIVE